MKKSAGKKGEAYRIELKRNLKPEEIEYLDMVLDLTTSHLQLFLKNDVVANKPDKGEGPSRS